MKRSHLSAVLFAVVFVWAISSQYAYTQNLQQQAPSMPAEATLIVPADTTIPLVLRNTINSRTARAGQSIYCDSIFPITVGNRIVIPRGSYVKGSITKVVRPGRGKNKGQIGIRFDTLILPDGTTRALRATLSGFGTTGREEFKPKESQIESASTKGEDAGKVAQTTITGAEIGTIAGVTGRHVVEGLGIGSAVGAAGGLVWVAASHGKEIVLPSGTNFELQLSAPLTFNREELGAPSPDDAGPALPK